MNKLALSVTERMRTAALVASRMEEDEHINAINSFCDDLLPSVLAEYGCDDIPAINKAFNDYTDMLCKDGIISTETYNNITFDF